MQYLKRNTKYSLLAFLLIVLSITISISTFAKTEVYFSLSDNPQKAIIWKINQAQTFINIAMYVFPHLAKTKTKVININSASQEELTSILQISEPLAQKIITACLTQLPEITNLE
jgi:hypothetical protein